MISRLRHSLGVVRLVHLRELRLHPMRTFIAVLSVAAGVAMVLAVVVVVSATTASFEQQAEGLAGPAPLRVVGSTSAGGLQPADVWNIADTEGVAGVGAMVRGVVQLEETTADGVELLSDVIVIGVECPTASVLGVGCEDLAAGLVASPALDSAATDGFALRAAVGRVDLAPVAIVDELREQARLAADCGFDGVMLSEHHGSFSGYLPNPLMVSGFVLDAMERGWAGPCPLLLPLRAYAQVAEDIAWLAARFPDRVVLGVAAGSLVDDFEVMEVPHEERMPRFRRNLAPLAAVVSGAADEVDGRVAELLVRDRAIERCADHPIPVLSAAMGVPAARRAAQAGTGLIFDSLSTPEHLGEIAAAYRDAGGDRTAVLNRRVWIGDAPRSFIDAQVDLYKTYAASSAVEAWGGDELVNAPDAAAVAERLLRAKEVSGADALNLRIHSAGISTADIRSQIERLGDELLPLLR